MKLLFTVLLAVLLYEWFIPYLTYYIRGILNSCLSVPVLFKFPYLI